MIKDISIQYVTDENGKKQAVLIPYEEWVFLQKEIEELAVYRQMKSNLRSAFLQVEQIKSGKLPRRTMKDFLNEC